MNNSVFKETRKRMKLSQSALADELGLSLRMVQYFESGEQPISRTIEFALRWICYRDYSLLIPNEYQDELNI